MQSRHIVIQVDIGEGTQWGNNQTINPIREISKIKNPLN